MRRKREECGLFIDLPHRSNQPQVGDCLISRGVRGYGTAYLVLRVRKVKRRKASTLARYSLRCARVALEDTLNLQTFMFTWYKRNTTRQRLIRPLPF
jgi:hypothetical protein